ncbi:FabD/lysophospholipase-like protein [Xylaria bambusicola]|uniref:FabD/lysophospholipase-like protein n=1 Tax=Xylaria bambusicola TaxID=326684 RepID=UPI002007D5DB|nr:FabD/lysophospholipase-like protein [Xylaria bambusicola]KAI0517620.1 FabD/lysophospholipase-like protein [Xylaria bambusicola]
MIPGSQNTACYSCHHHDRQTYSCIQCNNLSFCNDCWSKWVLHQPGAVGYDDRPHEKADVQVVQRLRQILDPKRTESDHEKDLQNDDDTTWFGVERDSSNQAIFQDHGRFTTLMTDSHSSELGNRYPQLVSFIGQTGAGKSTLIKMLINRLGVANTDRNAPFPSPVTSSNNDRVPTTGDVHLYADPKTYYGKTPMLYADCEGLDGGETIPKGLRHRTKEISDYCRHASQRDIAWAVTPETKKREYAVTQLYPRLLYTFSDVVVFVMRNPRSFESTVLEKLLEWGSSSTDKSLNQPTLPHAIIVLNATENVDEKEWDVSIATDLLLDDVRGAIFREPRFEEHARIFRQSGRKINSTKDLLECYYASITIIRVPARGRYMLIDKQVNKLYDIVNKKCQASLLTKKRVRMLATAERLQIYLQAAYDHFSSDLDTPFDFVKEALKHSPIPRDFGGNILSLALSIKQNCQDDMQSDIIKIFDRMVPMISSCIMLDSIRQNLMGTTVQLLDDAYVEFCEQALEEFANLHTPCAFVSQRSGLRCCNVKSGHLPKGHQDMNGRFIGPGGYMSDFDFHDYKLQWIGNIKTMLNELQSRFFNLSHQYKESPDSFIAKQLHNRSINDFFRSLGNDATLFNSHSTCFSCLRELPEHALPCGHVLCLPCVKEYGIKVSKTAIELKHCPLHSIDTNWDPPWVVAVKPAHAGVRVLSLDGGGVRGIVALQTLKAIERYLGPNLPIQYFFDLIVGTSTGGIIALGLGVNNWTVNECITQFKELCRQAFIPREMHGVPILEKLAAWNHGSIYKTKPFEKMLEKVFTSRPIFGGASDDHEMLTKVAITTTSSIAQHAVVLANYNRPDPTEYDLPYRFDRSDGPAKEFKAWEAARATSAAPPYFKPFLKHETQNSFIDGALYHNNPVWVAHHERKLIWTDKATSPPDILLSLGTGKHDVDNEEPSRSAQASGVQSPSQGKLKERVSQSFPRQMLNIAIDRIDKLLECNTIWNNYLAENTSSDFGRSNNLIRRRFIRINPDLRFEVPRLDAVKELERLEKAAIHNLKQNSPRIKEIAHRLIASSFFFEKDSGSVRSNTTGYECTGSIHCRFANSSEQMKAMGVLLRRCLGDHFEPFFTIEEEGHHDRGSRVVITEAIISDMCLRGIFPLDSIRIQMSKELAVTIISLSLQKGPYPHTADALLPISGFPRELVTEEIELKG